MIFGLSSYLQLGDRMFWGLLPLMWPQESRLLFCFLCAQPLSFGLFLLCFHALLTFIVMDSAENITAQAFLCLLLVCCFLISGPQCVLSSTHQ